MFSLDMLGQLKNRNGLTALVHQAIRTAITGTVVETQFGVRYSPVSVWKLLRHGLGWSWQKPERRALQRDEAAIEHWKTKVAPDKTTPPDVGATSCFSMKAAFC